MIPRYAYPTRRILSLLQEPNAENRHFPNITTLAHRSYLLSAFAKHTGLDEGVSILNIGTKIKYSSIILLFTSVGKLTQAYVRAPSEMNPLIEFNLQ